MGLLKSADCMQVIKIKHIKPTYESILAFLKNTLAWFIYSESITLLKKQINLLLPIWIVAVNESRPNYVSYHFIFFLKIWLGGFDKQPKVSISFCYFFVILLTGSNHRFSEKIQTLEMYYHHFTWLLYLVICHFGKNCSKRLKISEMNIYSSYLYFWIFI